MNWKYTDATNTVVFRNNGKYESCLVSAIADWIALGNTPDPADPPTAGQVQSAKDATDAAAAKSDAKLVALATMNPAQVRAWVAANVNTLADAKDAIATLAVVDSILARRL